MAFVLAIHAQTCPRARQSFKKGSVIMIKGQKRRKKLLPSHQPFQGKKTKRWWRMSQTWHSFPRKKKRKENKRGKDINSSPTTRKERAKKKKREQINNHALYKKNDKKPRKKQAKHSFSITKALPFPTNIG